MFTLDAIREWGRSELTEAGCADPGGDARTLLVFALQIDGGFVDVNGDGPITATEELRYRQLIDKRRNRIPLEYIIGWAEFGSLRLHVDPRAHVPSRCSEHFLRFIERLNPGDRHHDAATGCGAIAALSKYTFSDLVVSASDISRGAFDVARGNFAALELDIELTNLPWLPHGAYELVTANLPYADERQEAFPVPPEYRDHQPPIAQWAHKTDPLALIKEFARIVRTDPKISVQVTAFQHAPHFTDKVRSLFHDPETIETGDPLAAITAGHLL